MRNDVPERHDMFERRRDELSVHDDAPTEKTITIMTREARGEERAEAVAVAFYIQCYDAHECAAQDDETTRRERRKRDYVAVENDDESNVRR